jgi:hypothetical protein
MKHSNRRRFSTSPNSNRSLAAATLLAAAFLTNCGENLKSEDAIDAQTQAQTPPSNQARSVSCALENEGTTARQFRGKTISYYDSQAIAYHQDNWWKESQPWISKDGLDSSLLKHPGYGGTSPAFVASQPVNVRLVVVDIRKVAGKLVYHYFSNETANSPLENWSSTKGLVMTQAAHTLRFKHGISMLSKVSNSQSFTGSSKWIADHVNDVALTSNNQTAAWFKSITGPQGSQNFVRNWLVGTNDSNTAFGGAHGEAPAQHGNWFSDNGTGAGKKVSSAGQFNSISANTLMPVLMAEFWKRIAVNSSDPTTWLKAADYAGPVQNAQNRATQFFQPQGPFSLTDTDLKVLLYGYVNSTQNGGLQLGATQHGEFVDAFGGQSKLDALTGGKWRFFGKTGSGFSGSRSRNEAAFGGSICIPADASRSVLKAGRQIAFFVNVQAINSAGPPRLDVLKGISAAMIPELSGATSLWK